jgi:hypothetical protein
MAGDRAYVVRPQGAVLDKLVVAPGSVMFFGMNPLRFPDWNVSIDDKLVAGPSAYNVSSFVGGNAIGDVDSDSLQGAAASTPPPALTDVYDANATLSTLQSQCDFPASDQGEKKVDACTALIEADLKVFIDGVGLAKNELSRATMHKVNLIASVDGAVSAAGIIYGKNEYDQYIADIRRRIFDTHLLRRFVHEGQHVRPWPKLMYDDLDKRLTSLDDLATKKSKDATERLLDPSVAQSCVAIKKRLDALNALINKTKKPPKDILDLRTALEKQLELVDVDKLGKLRTRFNGIHDKVVAWQKVIKPFAPGGEDEKKYSASYGLLREFLSGYALRASIDRFGYLRREDCAGLSGGGRERIYTVSLNGTGDVRAKVRVVCRPRMFLSGGIAFSGLAQPKYELVPAPVPVPGVTSVSPGATPVPTPTPGAAPTPVAQRIVARTATDRRATAIILNNIRLSSPDRDDGFYASVGLGIQLDNSTGGLSGDYLAGISYSFSKTLVITAGTQFGQKTELAPGYREGDLVGNGTQIQTVTRVAPRFFLGFTFGKAS